MHAKESGRQERQWEVSKPVAGKNHGKIEVGLVQRH
jgi:hypothetical protein